jgi:SAM-dependent methyltransferase
MSERRDYQDWHRRYDDPGSGLSWRLERVQHHLRDAFDRHPGPVGVLSVCSGDGRDLLGVLAGRGDAERVSAVLLELHPGLARQARDAAAATGLGGVQVRTVDASDVDAYRGAVPADVVLLVGIFGNVADDDVWRLVAFAPQLCRPGATLVWSRGRRFSRDLPGVTAGDLNDEVRRRFAATGFVETAYETRDSDGRPALGVVRYDGPPVPLRPDPRPLFTFLR